jgi:DNA-binding HxlR family transcriptional regulator
LQVLSTESEFVRTHKGLESKYLSVTFADCPVQASLGILGKKWTFLIIREISTYGRDRFSRILRALPGIPPKVLTIRLRELELGGFIQKYVEKSVPPKVVKWSLTEKGVDAVRVAMMLAGFGSRWYADRVFEDKKPRKIHEIFNREGMELLMKDL